MNGNNVGTGHSHHHKWPKLTKIWPFDKFPLGVIKEAWAPV